MTKEQIIASAIELSGRVDLSETLATGTTKGTFFLNAALRLLDTTQQTPESKRWLMKDVAIGTYKLQFENCRAIHEVWMANSDSRKQLALVDVGWLRERYHQADVTNGTPLYYAPDLLHLAPQQKDLTDEDPVPAGKIAYTDEFTYDYYSLMFGDSYGYNGILWMPPVDEIKTVEVLATWFSVMSSNEAQCYWSVVYPNVLVQAMLFAIEVFYRNSAGMKDMMAALEPYLNGINFDLAEQESVDMNQMEG